VDDKLSYAAGQIHAHMCLLRALIAVHPDRESLLKEFASRRDIAVSLSISSDVTEGYLEGLSDESESLTEGFTAVVRDADS
jgi:hypothetical protein